MRFLPRSHPSPAIVVAILALVAAVAGTAVAEQATTSAKKTLTKKKVKQIADKRIAAQALGNDVITRHASVQVPDGGAEGESAECAAGEKIIGGGATPVGTGPGERVVLVASGPIVPGTPGTGGLPFSVVPAEGSSLAAWGGFMRNEEGTTFGGPGGTATLNVFAVCSR